MRLKKGDIILIGFVVAVSIFFLVFKSASKNGDNVFVYVDNSLFGEYLLNDECEIDITDEDNNLLCVLIINNNCANVIDASCPDKLCVKQQKISIDGESICCLPNRVLIEVKAHYNNSGYDAITK